MFKFSVIIYSNTKLKNGLFLDDEVIVVFLFFKVFFYHQHLWFTVLKFFKIVLKTEKSQ